MTAGINARLTPLTTPGNGARTYARALAEASAFEPSAAQPTTPSTKITSTEVGLNLGKFQFNYTSHEMTVDLAEVVHDALRDRSASFAEELDLAQSQQAAPGRDSDKAAPAPDTPSVIPPRRAALAYARTQGLDTMAAAMHSLGSI